MSKVFISLLINMILFFEMLKNPAVQSLYAVHKDRNQALSERSSVMKCRNMKVATEISHLNSMGKFLQGPVDQWLFLKNYS